MSTFDSVPWEKIETTQSSYQDGIVGVQINIKYPSAISEEERNVIYEYTYKIQAILERKYLLSKKNLPLERESLLNCFPSHIFAEEIPNEYDGLAPWFLVTTTKGRIKIGWRKRVINIDWTDTIFTQKAIDLFSDDVTKFDRVVHACGYEKAKEYLTKILES